MFNLTARLDNLLTNAALRRKFLTKRCALFDAVTHQIQAALGSTDLTHTVVDAARAKATLGNFKTTTFTQNDVFYRYTYMLKQNLAVALR